METRDKDGEEEMDLPEGPSDGGVRTRAMRGEGYSCHIDIVGLSVAVFCRLVAFQSSNKYNILYHARPTDRRRLGHESPVQNRKANSAAKSKFQSAIRSVLEEEGGEAVQIVAVRMRADHTQRRTLLHSQLQQQSQQLTLPTAPHRHRCRLRFFSRSWNHSTLRSSPTRT